MQITLSELPISIQNKIPLSLRLKNTFELDTLPKDVRYIINNYIEKNNNRDIKYNKYIYDLIPDISIYNDLTTIADKKLLIRHYLKNYLSISVSAYPFDCNFGSRLKQFVNTKDTSLKQTLITNEINQLVGTIATDYNLNINVESIEILPVKQPMGYTDYLVNIDLKLDNTSLTISV